MEYWATMKRDLRYFQGTFKYFIFYYGDVLRDLLVDISGYIDFDWKRDVDRRRSMGRYVF
jgi:hypothetical protein